MKKFNNGKGKMYKPAVEEIVLGYLYPRLDVHVTEQRFVCTCNAVCLVRHSGLIVCWCPETTC